MLCEGVLGNGHTHLTHKHTTDIDTHKTQKNQIDPDFMKDARSWRASGVMLVCASFTNGKARFTVSKHLQTICITVYKFQLPNQFMF